MMKKKYQKINERAYDSLMKRISNGIKAIIEGLDEDEYAEILGECGDEDCDIDECDCDDLEECGTNESYRAKYNKRRKHLNEMAILSDRIDSDVYKAARNYITNQKAKTYMNPDALRTIVPRGRGERQWPADELVQGYVSVLKYLGFECPQTEEDFDTVGENHPVNSRFSGVFAEWARKAIERGANIEDIIELYDNTPWDTSRWFIDPQVDKNSEEAKEYIEWYKEQQRLSDAKFGNDVDDSEDADNVKTTTKKATRKAKGERRTKKTAFDKSEAIVDYETDFELFDGDFSDFEDIEPNENDEELIKQYSEDKSIAKELEDMEDVALQNNDSEDGNDDIDPDAKIDTTIEDENPEVDTVDTEDDEIEEDYPPYEEDEEPEEDFTNLSEVEDEIEEESDDDDVNDEDFDFDEDVVDTDVKDEEEIEQFTEDEEDDEKFIDVETCDLEEFENPKNNKVLYNIYKNANYFQYNPATNKIGVEVIFVDDDINAELQRYVIYRDTLAEIAELSEALNKAFELCDGEFVDVDNLMVGIVNKFTRHACKRYCSEAEQTVRLKTRTVAKYIKSLDGCELADIISFIDNEQEL